jgi:hypothetical protein
LAKVLEERPNFFPARMMKGEIAAFNKDFSEAIAFSISWSRKSRALPGHTI